MAAGMRILGFSDLAEAHNWLDEQTDEVGHYFSDEGADQTEICLTLADGRRRNPLPVLVDREPYEMDEEDFADVLDDVVESIRFNGMALHESDLLADDHDDFEIIDGVPEEPIMDEDTVKTVLDSPWERLRHDQNNVQIPPYGTPLSVIVPGVRIDIVDAKPVEKEVGPRPPKRSSWKDKKAPRQFMRHDLSP